MSALTIDNLSERIVKKIQTNPEAMERVRLMIENAFPDADLLEEEAQNSTEKKYSILDFVGVASHVDLKAWQEDVEASRNEWD
jgi:hypothetical protein